MIWAKTLLYLSILCWVIVLLASVFMLLFPNFFLKLDKKISLNKERKNWLEQLALIINYGISVQTVCIFYFLIGILLIWMHEWHILGIGVSAMLIASVSFFSIKRITQRPRPHDALLHFRDYSFPSGHTTAWFVFFLSLALAGHWAFGLEEFAAPLYILALICWGIVGRSRRYLKVHRVSDIIVGWFLGIGSFLFSYLFFFYFWEAIIRAIELVFFTL